MAQSVSKAGGVRGMYAGHTSVAEGGGGCQFIEADAHLYQGTGESHSIKRKPNISTFTSGSGRYQGSPTPSEGHQCPPSNSLSRPPFKILMCVLHPQIIKFLLHFLASLSTKRPKKRVGLVKNPSGCFYPPIVWWIRSANFAPIEKGMKNEWLVHNTMYY